MGKRKYYFPPKATPKKTQPKTPTAITVDDEVKAELLRIAEETANRIIEERKAEDLNNYIAFTLESLNRLGWGKDRLNRFLSVLTAVSEEASNADNSPAYADDIKKRLTMKGVTAFRKNDDAAPQLEENGERKR